MQQAILGANPEIATCAPFLGFREGEVVSKAARFMYICSDSELFIRIDSFNNSSDV